MSRLPVSTKQKLSSEPKDPFLAESDTAAKKKAKKNAKKKKKNGEQKATPSATHSSSPLPDSAAASPPTDDRSVEYVIDHVFLDEKFDKHTEFKKDQKDEPEPRFEALGNDITEHYPDLTWLKQQETELDKTASDPRKQAAYCYAIAQLIDSTTVKDDSVIKYYEKSISLLTNIDAPTKNDQIRLLHYLYGYILFCRFCDKYDEPTRYKLAAPLVEKCIAMIIILTGKYTPNVKLIISLNATLLKCSGIYNFNPDLGLIFYPYAIETITREIEECKKPNKQILIINRARAKIDLACVFGDKKRLEEARAQIISFLEDCILIKDLSLTYFDELISASNLFNTCCSLFAGICNTNMSYSKESEETIEANFKSLANRSAPQLDSSVQKFVVLNINILSTLLRDEPSLKVFLRTSGSHLTGFITFLQGILKAAEKLILYNSVCQSENSKRNIVELLKCFEQLTINDELYVYHNRQLITDRGIKQLQNFCYQKLIDLESDYKVSIKLHKKMLVNLLLRNSKAADSSFLYLSVCFLQLKEYLQLLNRHKKTVSDSEKWLCEHLNMFIEVDNLGSFKEKITTDTQHIKFLHNLGDHIERLTHHAEFLLLVSWLMMQIVEELPERKNKKNKHLYASRHEMISANPTFVKAIRFTSISEIYSDSAAYIEEKEEPSPDDKLRANLFEFIAKESESQILADFIKKNHAVPFNILFAVLNDLFSRQKTNFIKLMLDHLYSRFKEKDIAEAKIEHPLVSLAKQANFKFLGKLLNKITDPSIHDRTLPYDLFIIVVKALYESPQHREACKDILKTFISLVDDTCLDKMADVPLPATDESQLPYFLLIKKQQFDRRLEKAINSAIPGVTLHLNKEQEPAKIIMRAIQYQVKKGNILVIIPNVDFPLLKIEIAEFLGAIPKLLQYLAKKWQGCPPLPKTNFAQFIENTIIEAIYNCTFTGLNKLNRIRLDAVKSYQNKNKEVLEDANRELSTLKKDYQELADLTVTPSKKTQKKQLTFAKKIDALNKDLANRNATYEQIKKLINDYQQEVKDEAKSEAEIVAKIDKLELILNSQQELLIALAKIDARISTLSAAISREIDAYTPDDSTKLAAPTPKSLGIVATTIKVNHPQESKTPALAPEPAKSAASVSPINSESIEATAVASPAVSTTEKVASPVSSLIAAAPATETIYENKRITPKADVTSGSIASTQPEMKRQSAPLGNTFTTFFASSTQQDFTQDPILARAKRNVTRAKTHFPILLSRYRRIDPATAKLNDVIEMWIWRNACLRKIHNLMDSYVKLSNGDFPSDMASLIRAAIGHDELFKDPEMDVVRNNHINSEIHNFLYILNILIQGRPTREAVRNALGIKPDGTVANQNRFIKAVASHVYVKHHPSQALNHYYYNRREMNNYAFYTGPLEDYIPDAKKYNKIRLGTFCHGVSNHMLDEGDVLKQIRITGDGVNLRHVELDTDPDSHHDARPPIVRVIAVGSPSADADISSTQKQKTSSTATFSPALAAKTRPPSSSPPTFAQVASRSAPVTPYPSLPKLEL